jgi:hypothetical protein
MAGSPRRIAALTRVAAIQHELDYPGGSPLLDPMGVTVFGDGDRAAALGADADPAAVRATRRNLPFPSRFDRITKIQHFETISLPRATHVYGDETRMQRATPGAHAGMS